VVANSFIIFCAVEGRPFRGMQNDVKQEEADGSEETAWRPNEIYVTGP
jgi:hypothetical protein